MQHYLVGGSGIPNFGDELIADSWIDLIDSRGSNVNVSIDVKNIRASRASLKPRDNVRHISLVRRLIEESQPSIFKRYFDSTSGRGKETVWDEIKRGRNYFKDSKSRWRPLLDKELQELKQFHIFGGGYINSRWPASAFLLGLGVAVKEQTGIPVFATGLGLMPWARPEAVGEVALAEEIGECYELFEVRDRASGRVSGVPGVITGLDDAFLVSPPAICDNVLPTMHVAVSFTKDSFEVFGKKLLLHIRSHWACKTKRIVFWNSAPEKDRFALKAFRTVFPNVLVFDSYNIRNWPIVFGPNDFMIATRFHPHLMAARAGVPGYFIQNNRYYSIKHGSLLDLGSGFSEVSVSDLPTTTPEGRGILFTKDAELHSRKIAMALELYAS